MNGKRTKQENKYLIRIKGILNLSLADWLEDITVIPQEHGETLLVGQFADQPALRGLLDQLWNLNFTLLSVERNETKNDQVSRQTEIERRQE